MRPGRTFFIISALLALTIALVVWKGYLSAEQLLINNLIEQGKQYQNAFTYALDTRETAVLKVPVIIANDPVVRRLLIKADSIINTTGHHSPQAAVLRRELLAHIKPLWTGLRKEFDIRQLHFHLATNPGSFLRVHQPEKFADKLSSIRNTVNFANQAMQPTSGLEIGRASLGIRGVYPIIEKHADSDSPRVIGSIDVGSSTSATLKQFHSHFGADIAILLNNQQLRQITWADVYQNYIERGIIGNYVIEEISRANLLTKLTQASKLLSTPGTDMILIDDQNYALTRFPLRDFLGTIQKERAPIGLVTIFANITNDMARLRQSLLHNSLNALGVFLSLEIILFLLWNLSHRGLQQLVDSHTNELEQANRQLKRLASSDALTGIANRRAFNHALDREWVRAVRDSIPISLIMCDIDYFKQYNDIYGHLEGDECLQKFAQALHKCIARRTDLLARYGGEEFCALLPNTDHQEAWALANKMKKQVCELNLPHNGSSVAKIVTASFGVATINPQPQSNHMTLIKAADEALYNAKAAGRNQLAL